MKHINFIKVGNQKVHKTTQTDTKPRKIKIFGLNAFSISINIKISVKTATYLCQMTNSAAEYPLRYTPHEHSEAIQNQVKQKAIVDLFDHPIIVSLTEITPPEITSEIYHTVVGCKEVVGQDTYRQYLHIRQGDYTRHSSQCATPASYSHTLATLISLFACLKCVH